MIGFARPFLNEIDFPKTFLADSNHRIKDASFDIKIKQFKDFAEAGFYDYQIARIAEGKQLKPGYNPYLAIVRLVKNEIKKGWF